MCRNLHNLSYTDSKIPKHKWSSIWHSWSTQISRLSGVDYQKYEINESTNFTTYSSQILTKSAKDALWGWLSSTLVCISAIEYQKMKSWGWKKTASFRWTRWNASFYPIFSISDVRFSRKNFMKASEFCAHVCPQLVTLSSVVCHFQQGSRFV